MSARTRFARTSIIGAMVMLVASGVFGGAQAAQAEVAQLDAQAAEPVGGATLDWGIRESFRNYITGPIAHGTVAQVGATTGAGPFSWRDGVASGTAAADGTGLEIEFGTGDGVHFLGHAQGEDHILDLTMTHPRLTISEAGSAELYMDITGREFINTTTVGEMRTWQDVHFADVVLTPPTMSGRVATWTNATATMTSAGLEAFGNFYSADSAQLDPLTFSATLPEEPETPGPLATTSALTANPSSPYAGADVALTATVQPAEVAGAVQFTVGGKAIGTPVPVEQGVAQKTVRATDAATYRYGAVFTPTDAAAYRGSKATAPDVVLSEEVTGTQGTLQWGVKKSFRSYVVGPIAGGSIAPSGGATQSKNNGVFSFPQASRTGWNGTTGSVQYAGNINFSGHHGQMDVDLRNPTIVVKNAKSAELQIPLNGKSIALADIDLSKAERATLPGGAVKFTHATTQLTRAGATQFFVNDVGEGPGSFYSEGDELDELTFIIGADSGTQPTPDTGSKPKPKPKPGAKPTAPVQPVATDSAAAGSLSWSVSNAFVAYTTCANKEAYGYSHCAKGSIETNGVGTGYLFPQAASSSWDRASQTGTVAYSGTVAFRGYGMTMFNVANPSITVTSPTSATIATGNGTSFGAGSYQLDLGSASKTVGANGEVTWSNVPVLGALSSGGAGGSGARPISLDPLTFTVGAESQVSYGSTAAGADTKKYTAAKTVPATTGVTVLTHADKLKPGGRIEIEAAGFDPDDEGVLVVLYSDPIVLDEKASADKNGVVRWSGKLPDDVTGTHTITVQGSTNAGAVIDIVEPKPKKSARSAAVDAQSAPGQVARDRVTSAGFLPASSGMAVWEWWVSAGGLAAIAACMTVLTIRQRRTAG